MTFSMHIIPAVVILMASTLLPNTEPKSLGYTGSSLNLTVTIAGVTFDLSVRENGTNVTLRDGVGPVHSNIDVYVEVTGPAPLPSSILIENRLGLDVYSEHTCNLSHMCQTRIQLAKAQAEGLRAEVLIVLDFGRHFPGQIFISETIVLEGNSWSATPGNFSVLEQTDAIFNWTFTLRGPINIAWFYRGTAANPTAKYILERGQNKTFIPLWSPRLEYVYFPGSAVMIIRNVTSADGGRYEAKVADVHDIFRPYAPSISDIVTLSVIADSDLTYTVTIADVTFDLCVAENGTDVTLPDVVVTSPTIFDVRVQFVSTAPQPSDIRINSRVGPLLYNTSCEQNRTCTMQISSNVTQIAIEIFFNITFDIQNTSPITIAGPATIGDEKTEPENIRTIELVTGICVGMVVGVGIVVGIVVGWRKIRKRNNTDPESVEMTSLLTESKRNVTVMQFKPPVEEHNKVPYLERYVVADEKLKWAEYCFHIALNVATLPRDDTSVKHLKQILTALLNTSGGIIELENGGNRTAIADYRRHIESVLTDVIPEVDRKWVTLSGAQFPLRLLVKKSDRLITLNTHMYIRQSGCNKRVTDTRTTHDVRSQPSLSPPPYPFDASDSLDYGSEIQFTESDEYGYITPDQFINSQFPNDFTESLLSLPNMPGGGYLIIGMEHNNTVAGVTLHLDEDAFSDSIGHILKTTDGTNPCIWAEESRDPCQGADWTIRFIPVTGGPTEERRSLIVVGLNHCPGGVWAKCPESFMVSEDGSVFQMTFDSWKEASNKTSDVRTARIESSDIEAENHNDQTTSATATNTIDVARNYKKAPPFTNQDNVMENNAYVDDVLKEKDDLSFAKSSKLPLKDRLKDATIDLFNTAELLAKNSPTFHVNTPMTMTPKKETIIARFGGDAEDVATAIDRIEAAQDNDVKSFGIVTFSRSQESHGQPEAERPTGRLLDVLVIDEKGRIKVWAVVNERTIGYDQKQIATLTLVSGRKAKRTILLNQPYFAISTHEYISSVSVNCHVYEIGHRMLINPAEGSESAVARYFNTSQHNLRGITIAVAKALLKATTIKSIYGDEYHYTLTSEQLNIIHNNNLGMNKFSYVEGLPGSGKSHLALFICKNYSNCGYICTTETFKKYLLYQGLDESNVICIANIRKASEDVKHTDFTQFEYLVFDDVHNSELPKGAWKQICESVARSARTKLIVFGDTRYQNFMDTQNRKTFLSYMRKFCQNTKHPTLFEMELKEIHRNTKNVSSFIAANFEENTAIPCSRKDEGEDVVVKRISNVWSNTDSNGLAKYVRDSVDPAKLEDTKNEPKEVAILVDISKKKHRAEKNPAKLMEIFRRIFTGDTEVHDAGTFPVTGLTIDTLSNFMGFDRKVCILVSDENIQTTRKQTGHSFENPKYKAFVASRGTSKVVFVVESDLNASLASKFHCDNITSSDPRRLWEREAGKTILSVCWLPLDDTAALLYATGGEVRLVTVGGERRELTMDTSRLQPRHVSSSPDGRTVVITDLLAETWTVFSRQSASTYVRGQTHKLDGRLRDVCCTPDGGVVVLVDEPPDVTLRRYELADGRLVWQQSVPPSRCLTVDPAGRLYAASGNTVHVYSPSDGGPVTSYTAPRGLSYITAVCADTGRRLLAGHYDGGVSLWLDGEVSRRRLTGTSAGGMVRGLGLYRDQYLAVGRGERGGLQLYDVAGALV